ncbi:hypothetical protein HHK36_017354 [Tetracentron sinense]|uniref:Uncharacterized protein n=1 Tax=Tetracentron sinense TaxID=13715 RepID=A0A834Z2C2_TETSI|nr:hypothetical protein HHK36_017354 [Tetracentron sinense]
MRYCKSSDKAKLFSTASFGASWWKPARYVRSIVLVSDGHIGTKFTIFVGEKGLFALAPPHQGIDGEWSDGSGVSSIDGMRRGTDQTLEVPIERRGGAVVLSTMRTHPLVAEDAMYLTTMDSPFTSIKSGSNASPILIHYLLFFSKCVCDINRENQKLLISVSSSFRAFVEQLATLSINTQTTTKCIKILDIAIFTLCYDINKKS